MKRSLVPVLLSGLVLPGLGQFSNGQRIKGALLVAAVCGLLAGIVVAFYAEMERLMENMASAAGAGGMNSALLAVGGLDLSTVWLLVLALAAVWIYSIVDAAVCAPNKNEKEA